MRHNTVNDTLYGTRNHSTWIIYSISHGITAANFYRNLIFFRQLHQFQTKWNNITVNICSGNILQMASWTDSHIQTVSYDTQVMEHGLKTSHLHLIKNMIIGTADQNTGFFQAHILYKLKILFIGTNPAGYFRELIPFFQTFFNSIPVFFTIQEKFTGTDLTVWATQLMKIIIDPYDLFCRIRLSGLLSITECGIRNPDIIWHMMRYNSVIKCDLRYFIVRKKVTEYVR